MYKFVTISSAKNRLRIGEEWMTVIYCTRGRGRCPCEIALTYAKEAQPIDHRSSVVTQAVAEASSILLRAGRDAVSKPWQHQLISSLSV